jgi:PAS domain S-box-containing protein
VPEESQLTAGAARRELYEIVRQDVPFEEKAREALDLGRRFLNVDNGHLTRIDSANDSWAVLTSTDSAEGQFPPGLELDLRTTYCRESIESDSQIALHDASKQGWADDPAFEAHGLHCYLGTPIYLNTEPFGTVCFVSAEPRSEPFSDGETMFAELIARLLERELESAQDEAELTRQTNLAIVLSRVLRHNLRNDVSIIRGYIELMADRLDDDDISHIPLRNIDDLIDLSDKARQLDRIVAADFDHDAVDVPTLVADVVETVADRHPSASLSADHGDPVSVPLLPSFAQAVEELVDNAAKHGGTAVTVAVESDPQNVEIRIQDDGPGLAAHEIDVLKSGSETPLTHGSGLGLWLAHWIVTSHGGDIEATSTATGTTMTITVPRTPAMDAHRNVDSLERALDQYQAAFEEASDAIVIVNDDARIVDANPAAAQLYGVTRRQLLGRPLADFFSVDFAEGDRWDAFRDVTKGRDTARIVGDDGVERLVEYAATSDIVPRQHLLVSRDISDRVASKLQLDTIVDNLPGYVYRYQYGSGQPSEFVKGSPESVTGYTAAELEANLVHAVDIVHPEDRKGVLAAVEDALESTGKFDLTYRIITKSGEERWVRDQGQLIEDPVSGAECLDGFIMDVTARREREQELQTMTRRLEAILENSTTPMFMKDDDGEYIFVNRAYRDLFGLADEKIVGRIDDEIHPSGMAAVTRKNDRAVIERGEPITVEESVVADGEELTFLSTKVPIYDTGERSDPENPVAVFGVATDITERVETEKQLRTEQEFVRSLFQSLPDPVYAFDTDGNPIRWNEQFERLSGYSAEEIEEMSVLDFVPEDETETIAANFQTVLEERRSVTVVSAFETKGGVRVPFEFAGSPLENPDGTLRGVTGVGRGLSERG